MAAVRRAVSALGVTLLAALAPSGCEPGERGPLTDVTGWRELPPSEDPYDDRPPRARCEPFGWKVEDGLLEVEADVCEYVTLEQGLLREVAAGETVVVDVWHLGLWADRPTRGHVSVQLGAQRWEARPAIPSPAERWQAVFEVERTLPAGTPIHLHVHNHGANSWRFGPPTAR